MSAGEGERGEQGKGRWGEQASGGVAEGNEECGEKGGGAGRAEQRERRERFRSVSEYGPKSAALNFD